MRKIKKAQYSHQLLMTWLGNDPAKEAILISEVPIKAATLARIKTGIYKPSAILAHAIMAAIKESEQ